MVPSVLPWVPLPLPGAPKRMNVRYFTCESLGRRRIDIDPAAGAIKSHCSVNQGKNGVIAAEPDVFAGLEFCAALTDDDVAGDHHLAPEFFHAEPLTDAVAAIFDAALSFFMSHCKS